MTRIEEAQGILKVLGLPAAQQSEIAALTLLALCGVGPNDSWTQATRQSRTLTKGIMEFAAQEYGKTYAPNTRETFRRQVLHQFIQARIADYNPDDPGLPTNSPRAHYALSEAARAVVSIYGTAAFSAAAQQFLLDQGSLTDTYRKRRAGRFVPIALPDGTILSLSPGKHNALQAKVISDFRAHFAPDTRLLYLGDTAKKNLVLDAERLASLNVPVTEHDKLPDVVLLDEEQNGLYLIEAVTSHGPVTPKRVVELRTMFARCPAGLVFVSAFLDFAEFRKHLSAIA